MARVPFLSLLFLLYLSSHALASDAADSVEHVLTLDASNFTDTVSKHPFIVVEFYAPWCGHCKSLAPEYEKAAAALSSHDPPIVLAKVDANDEKNKELASEFEVKGFPTLKILRKGGKSIQEYKGPRESDGIVEYLKKQAGPESVEIKSSDDASVIIDTKKIFIAGIFPQLSGEEFENFTAVADKLRSDYNFGHTVDAKNLPRGDTTVKGPLVRLLKPFDEMFVDFEDFNVDSLEKFVEEASIPTVTIFNKDPENHPFVVKFFNSPNAKAMLFLNFSAENFETFNSKYHDSASKLKGRGISFLIGDTEVSQGAFQFFGLLEEQVPLVIIQKGESTKYLKPNLKPEEIAPWLEEYLEDKLQAFRKSEPIPEFNNEPVKVVVADSLQDFVFNSGKNVLLEFYAPWCGHCKKLAPILDEVAVSFEDEKDVIIAKIDATANDYPSETFDVKGYPTLYFVSATGKVEPYEGDRSKDDIISFILKSKAGDSSADSTAESVKDEL